MSLVEPVDDMVTEATLQSDSGQFAVVVDKFTSIESLIRRRRCFPDVKDEIIAQINEVLKLIKCKEEVRLKSALIVLRAWSTGLNSQPERYKQHDSRREKGFFRRIINLNMKQAEGSRCFFILVRQAVSGSHEENQTTSL
jgi:hypothetical protein